MVKARTLPKRPPCARWVTKPLTCFSHLQSLHRYTFFCCGAALFAAAKPVPWASTPAGNRLLHQSAAALVCPGASLAPCWPAWPAWPAVCIFWNLMSKQAPAQPQQALAALIFKAIGLPWLSPGCGSGVAPQTQRARQPPPTGQQLPVANGVRSLLRQATSSATSSARPRWRMACDPSSASQTPALAPHASSYHPPCPFCWLPFHLSPPKCPPFPLKPSTHKARPARA